MSSIKTVMQCYLRLDEIWGFRSISLISTLDAKKMCIHEHLKKKTNYWQVLCLGLRICEGKRFNVMSQFWCTFCYHCVTLKLEYANYEQLWNIMVKFASYYLTFSLKETYCYRMYSTESFSEESEIKQG